MITIQELKNQYARHGAIWLPVNLFGIRHEENQKLDIFNDFLGIATDTEIHIVDGTTDPGRDATEHKAGGAAHLCLGFHKDIWAIDIHAANNPIFAHKAFCQRPALGTKPCKIFRDVNKDGDFDAGEPVQEGYFGINQHRASIHGSQHIGAYGAGCQVHQQPGTLSLFLEIAEKSGMKLFSYMLFDKSEIKI
jgi:hypothetical protein